MDLPEMRMLLFNHYRENKQVPNELVISMQRQMLETFGWEQEHGCKMLSKMAEVYPNDQELAQKFQYWQAKAQDVLMHCMKYAGAPVSLPLMQMLEQTLSEGEEMKELTKKAEEEIETMS